jgi:glycerol-3-phosphate acyltransferase PlsY
LEWAVKPPATLALALLVGFVCGSIPFGVLFARLRGIDLKQVGSGNIGATNAARALGKKIGVVVLLCDAAKAAVPLLVARSLLASRPELDWLLAALGFGAVLGHMFPPWLGFRGGKGVATGLGVFLTLTPFAAACAVAIWLGAYLATRVSSLGSLLAVTALPIAAALLHQPLAFIVLALALYPLIVWKHRANIRRLLHREETRL